MRVRVQPREGWGGVGAHFGFPFLSTREEPLGLDLVLGLGLGLRLDLGLDLGLDFGVEEA
jgi:hypothetical protein